MKFIRALTASLFFVAVLLAVYHAHITYFKVNVVFYSAILDAVLAAGVAGAVLFGMRYFRALGGFEKAQLVVIVNAPAPGVSPGQQPSWIR